MTCEIALYSLNAPLVKELLGLLYAAGWSPLYGLDYEGMLAAVSRCPDGTFLVQSSKPGTFSFGYDARTLRIDESLTPEVLRSLYPNSYG